LIRVTKLPKTKDHPDLEARKTNSYVNEGETMPYPSHGTTKPLFILLFVILPALVTAGSTLAQEKKVAQQNGVDNSEMGAYRALAQHIDADFQRGDLAAAALMAKVLERVWDKAEDYGGDTALSKKSWPVRTDRQGHGRFSHFDHRREGQSIGSCQGKSCL
jgi:hypothetical protein